MRRALDPRSHLQRPAGAVHSGATQRGVAALGALCLWAGACAPAPDPTAPLDEFERDLGRSEEAAAEVEAGPLRALTAWIGGLEVQPSRWGLDAAEVRAPQAGEFLPFPDGTLEVSTWAGPDPGAQDLAALANLLRPPGDLAFHRAQLDRFRLAPDGRVATGRATLEWGGEDASGGRSQTSAVARVRAERASGAWRLTAVHLEQVTRAACSLPPFADVTAAAGVTDGMGLQNQRLLQEGLDEHRTLALGGLTLLDWNRDGFTDLLATRKGQLTTLLLNDGQGGFLPTPHPLEAPAESPAFLLWVDLDGDGLEELVGSEPLAYSGDEARLSLWTRSGAEDGGWRRVDDALRLPNPPGLRRLAVQTLVPFDLEGDGDLDLFVAVYGSSRSRGTEYNTVEAHDGADNHLLINQGDLSFREESEARGITGSGYTYVATAFDFDADGHLDLFEGNDFGPNHVWRNRGDGTFEDQPEPGLTGFSAYTMGSSLADYDNEGVWSLYVSNMSSEEGARMVELPGELSEAMRSRVRVIAQGNGLHRQGAEGWLDHAVEAGCSEGEWAWGSVFFDPDGDGDQDLFVTNGFASHSGQNLPDWQTYYWRQVLADAGHLERGERSQDANADLRFRGSFNGYERDRLFWNMDGADPAGARRFVEAGWLLGLDLDHDGRAVAAFDADGDGDQDLALWTLQGLRLLANLAGRGPNLHLAPTVSGQPAGALGAVVSVAQEGRTQRAPFLLVEGFQTQREASLPFSLDAGAAAIEVRWPDGTLESFGSVSGPGRFALERGSGTPATRPRPAWKKPLEPTRGRPGLDARVLGPSGPAPIASPGAPTLVLWSGDPDSRALLAALRERAPALVAVEVAGEPRPDSALPTVGATAEARARFGMPAPDSPTVFAFDSRGALARILRSPLPGADALAPLVELLAEEPVFPELAVEAGRRALQQGRYREAEGLFRAALERAPGRTDAWDGLARTQLAFGRVERAEAAYASAVAADPDYALGHFNLGIARIQRRDLAGGILALQRSAALEPTARTLLALAEALGAAGRPEEGADAAARAAELEPGPDAAALLASLQLAAGDREGARRTVEAALPLAPEDPRLRGLELQLGPR
jgi:Flp pilus assembly protein TadD